MIYFIQMIYRNNIISVSILIAIAALSLLSAMPAYCAGPDVERGVREIDRFSSDKEKNVERMLFKIPEKQQATIPQVSPIIRDEKRFFIKTIELAGCESFTPSDFTDFIKEYENKEVTLTELSMLAKDIERDYLKKGVIAAVFVPPQEIKEEKVTLRVVEARMGAVRVKKHKYFNNRRLKKYWKIPQGDIVKYTDISRSVQMMNKNPDREVRTAIHAGKKPGTIDALLIAKPHFPIHGTFTFDREGAVSTGRARYGFGIRDNNALNYEDSVITGYSFGDHFHGIYAYHNLPISYSGTSVLYGVSHSEAQPGKDFKVYDLRTKAESFTISLHQDLYNKDNYMGEVYAGFDAKDKTVWWNNGTLNRDRIRVINFGGNFIKRSMGSIFYYGPQFAQGIPDFLGSEPDENPLASRGAKSQFSKWNFNTTIRTLLPFNLQQSWKVRTQFATPKLLPQEQYYLGGIDSVRGYPSGDYLADNVFQTNLEILIPAFFMPEEARMPYSQKSLKEDITGVVFVDYGLGGRRDDKKYHNMTGVGCGVRLNLYDMATCRFEWGLPIGDSPITECYSDPRFHVSVDFQDKLPDEIEYIKKIRQDERIRKSAYRLVDLELAKPDSPIRAKVYGYLAQAENYYKEGKLAESIQAYEKLAQATRYLYMQAEQYLRGCIDQVNELKDDRDLAMQYQEEGKWNESKKIWQGIIDEAKPKPLTFEI